MPVIYSQAALTGRLQGLADRMASGSIALLAGATVVATIALANPAATVSGTILEFTMPRTGTAVASGTVTSAVIKDSSNITLMEDLTVGLGGTQANIVIENGLNTMAIVVGQVVIAIGGQISSEIDLGDPVDYTDDGWNARFEGLINIIDANGLGVITVRAGNSPLSTIVLDNPCGVGSGGDLVFQGSLVAAPAISTGFANNAIILDGIGNLVVSGLTVGIPGSGSDILITNGFNTTLISAGRSLQLTSARITGN